MIRERGILDLTTTCVAEPHVITYPELWDLFQKHMEDQELKFT